MTTPFDTILKQLVKAEQEKNEAYKPGEGKALKYDCVYPMLAKLVGIDVTCNICAQKKTCLCKKHEIVINDFQCPFPNCCQLKKPENTYCQESICIIKECTNVSHDKIVFCEHHLCHKCKNFNDTGNKFCNKCKCINCTENPHASNGADRCANSKCHDL